MLNLICLIPVLAVGWAPADETSGPFNGLDRQVRLTGKPTLTEAIEQVATACDVRIVLDEQALQGRWETEPKEVALSFIPPVGAGSLVLRRFLHPLDLRAVKIGDHLLITTEEMAMPRILRQPVQIAMRAQPLASILRDLSKQTSATIIVDPRASEQAKATVSVALDDVSLETAVRVATEMAGLKMVRIETVIFVTTPSAAASIRSENDSGNGMIIGRDFEFRPNAGLIVPGNAGPAIPAPAPAQRNP